MPFPELLAYSGLKRRRLLEIVTGYGTKKRQEKLGVSGMLAECKLDMKSVKQSSLIRAPVSLSQLAFQKTGQAGIR